MVDSYACLRLFSRSLRLSNMFSGMSWDGSPQKSILESYDTSDMVDLTVTWRIYSFLCDQNGFGVLG